MPDSKPEEIIKPASQERIFNIDLEFKLPKLPPLDDPTKINIRYSLIKDFANVHVYWDGKTSEIVYEIEEPVLTEREINVFHTIERGIEELINISFVGVKDNDVVIEFLEKNVKILLDELNIKLTKESFIKIMYYIYRNFVGLNEIEPLMRDPFIEDIECNGSKTPLYIVHRVYRNMRTNLIFPENKLLGNFIEKLAQKCGKYISYANPMLDGRLPDGSRCNATFTEEISSKGPTFCFKSGYVQLNDGRIKKIKELFEESKINFGSKFEEGNEIVKPVGVVCCGVDKNNLEQKDSQIKSIIKLKAPKKLVKINFEDGGEIEVTPNHLFHVTEGSLCLIEAKNLKQGMMVPMPKKLNVFGYRQMIDIYSLLKDFSYLKRISVLASPQIKKLVSEEVQLCNTNGNYRRILAQKYGTSESYFYEVISRGNSISFSILDNLCKEKNVKFNSFGEISINIYGGGTKNKSKAIKLPKEIDDNLAYLAGALVSDGHLSKEYIDFSCFEEGFKNSIKNKLTKIFGRFDSYYDDNRVYLCNLFIPFFFNKVFGIPIGNKSRIVKVPDVIFKSDNKVIASFIRGLFDGDGTVSAGLSYKTYSKELAEGITYLLARLGISSYIRYYEEGHRINIPSPHYLLFQKLIGFDELKKSDGLNELIKKQVDCKTFIRHERIPGVPILSIINKLGIPRGDILKNCGVSYNRIYYPSFSRSFARKLLREIENNKDSCSVKKEIDYVRWMLDSEQEFTKITSVNVIDNCEPVYDLEIEPCKFFIAGNKPMNIFDTIRKFTKIPWTPIHMIALGTASPEMLAYLWLAIEHENNIMVIGGTGSGKTTFLNALSFFIPPQARIVSIEDTRELNIAHENWLPSIAREGIGATNLIGVKHGEVSLFDLLKESFRQRPDYVIVGEVRGAEANVLFQGMSSGHPSMGTIHAEDTNTMVRRLETPPISLSPSLVESLDIVCIIVQTKVGGKLVRKIREIQEIVKVSSAGEAITKSPFMWDPKTDRFALKDDSEVFGKLIAQQGISREKLLREFRARTAILNIMHQQKIFDSVKVQEIINEYYKTPAGVLMKLGIKI